MILIFAGKPFLWALSRSDLNMIAIGNMALLTLVMACQGLRCWYMARISMISVVVLTELLRMLPIRSLHHHLLILLI